MPRPLDEVTRRTRLAKGYTTFEDHRGGKIVLTLDQMLDMLIKLKDAIDAHVEDEIGQDRVIWSVAEAE